MKSKLILGLLLPCTLFSPLILLGKVSVGIDFEIACDDFSLNNCRYSLTDIKIEADGEKILKDDVMFGVAAIAAKEAGRQASIIYGNPKKTAFHRKYREVQPKIFVSRELENSLRKKALEAHQVDKEKDEQLDKKAEELDREIKRKLMKPYFT